MLIFVGTEHYNGLCLRRQTSPEFSCNLSISRFIIENALNLWPTKNSNQIMHRNFLLSTQTCHPVVSAFHPRSVSSSDPGVGDPEFWTTFVKPLTACFILLQLGSGSCHSAHHRQHCKIFHNLPNMSHIGTGYLCIRVCWEWYLKPQKTFSYIPMKNLI